MVTRRWVLCVNSCRQLLTRSSWKRGKAATDTPRASWQFWDGHKLSLSFGIHCLTTFVHPAPFQFLRLAWRHIFSARHLTHVIYTDETICLRISPLLVGVIILTLNILLLLLLRLCWHASVSTNVFVFIKQFKLEMLKLVYNTILKILFSSWFFTDCQSTPSRINKKRCTNFDLNYYLFSCGHSHISLISICIVIDISRYLTINLINWHFFHLIYAYRQ